MKTYVIVGGVAGGATAAARLRRIDEQSEIILFEQGEYISYANCGLPYYIGDVISERDKLLLQTPEGFGARYGVDVRIQQKVVSIDPIQKNVEIERKDGSRYTQNFDKLLLSPGAEAFVPPIDGVDNPRIFTLRDVRDTDRIKEFVRTNELKRAVVIGAGFIGVEMAENLRHLGIDVDLVEMADQVMPILDYSIAASLHLHMKEKGVNLFLGRKVEAFASSNQGVTVQLDENEALEADLVILSIGVRPRTQLARQASLKIGDRGGIWVNEYLQTSSEDIFAVGDAVEFPHPITGRSWLNYLANPANRQARIVADNMAKGNKLRYEGAIGTAIAKVFDMTVATTGLSGRALHRDNLPYQQIITHGFSHASYYPGALPLSIKLTFEPNTGVLYGAQVVGFDGVDKRIDQLALLIKQKGSLQDLVELEHAYAPPFSSAKDPIAIAGYAAGNVLSGVMPVITWRELEEIDREEVVLLDVRTDSEHQMGAIAGSTSLDVDLLRDRLETLDREKPIIVYCAVGLRGYLAQQILLQNGFKNVRNLLGGYRTYQAVWQSKGLRPDQNKSNKTSSIAEELKKKMNTIVEVDACGLQCPGPIMKVKEAIEKSAEGDQIAVVSTDPAFARDAESWCQATGHQFISSESDKGRFRVTLAKKSSCPVNKTSSVEAEPASTLILFSDDLDKALATFVLANGAAAMGKKVTIFFTFWGLNAIKRKDPVAVKKDLFGKMFGWMLPAHSEKLGLSKMNMGGMGSKMMRFMMKQKGVDALETMRQQALDQGVEFIACQMSMDVMGVAKEELLDGVSIGGVATYMQRAGEANHNLFI